MSLTGSVARCMDNWKTFPADGGVDGVIYRIQMTVITSSANTLVLLADLQILAPLSV